MKLQNIVQLLVIAYCALLYSQCTTQKQKPSQTIIDNETYSIDSFTIVSPLYVLNASPLISKLDSLIENAKAEQHQDFWNRKFPPYITIEPFNKMDSTFFKLKLGKDYLFNFDPPDLEFSKKVFEGFGAAKYKGLLVQLNGKRSNYSLVTDVEIISDTSEKISFNAYGIRNTERNSWVEYFSPFVRSYYHIENGIFKHYYSEVEK